MKTESEKQVVQSVLVGLDSPGWKLSGDRGTVRGLLYPTVHICESRDGKTTELKHILANNLRGVFPPYIQNTILSEALAEANLRDSLSQRYLFRAREQAPMEL